METFVFFLALLPILDTVLKILLIQHPVLSVSGFW